MVSKPRHLQYFHCTYMNAIFAKGSTFDSSNGRINPKTIAFKTKKTERKVIFVGRTCA
ncbi:hypothetical protein CES86_4861 [Brucella lupini]|uniref:Uncharacterized protein n=1 Tax=Brucella lupini TaxID=255457 RepID=A0A256GBR3_9HYPH|nr:hypothetical protein CES86_4861 [Brucella lupini]